MLAIGMTRSGSYYFAERRDRVDQIVVAKIDPTTTKPQESIRPIDTFIGRKAAWSPDGKYIASLRARPRDSRLLADQFDVVVRSFETGEEQTFSRDGFTDLGEPYPLLWFHDSKSFLTVFHDRPNSAVVLYRVELATREWKEILTLDISTLTSVKAISPDDKTIYFGASNSRPNLNRTPLNYVVALDLNTRQQKRLFTIPGSGASQFALSPDGGTFAMLGVPDATTKEARLSRIAVDGSNYLELPAFSHIEAQLWPRKLAWTPDGRTILFARQDERGKWQIMRLPADGRAAAESTGLEGADYLGTLDLSSDGSHIAFDTIRRESTELWVLDNVPSLLKAPR
jgi:Tol biopolymer transport system component